MDAKKRNVDFHTAINLVDVLHLVGGAAGFARDVLPAINTCRALRDDQDLLVCTAAYQLRKCILSNSMDRFKSIIASHSLSYGHVKLCTEEQDRLLHLAVRKGNIESIQVLIKHGAVVKKEHLLHAVRSSDLEFFKHLAGFFKEDKLALSEAMFAAASMSIPLVQYLLNLGASANYANLRGITGLMICARFHNIEGAKALIKHGADVRFQNQDGNTALHYAYGVGILAQEQDSENMQAEMVQLLLANGACPLVRNNRGQRPHQV